MPLPSLLMTGATGFLGRRFLDRLRPEEFPAVRCLVRTPQPPRPGVTWVAADLTGPVPDEAFAGVDTVVHLAAATGKVAPARHFAVNEAGTRTLLAGCARHGVRNFLFVSSVAARFTDQRHYPYARSKRAAEEEVAASGLRFTIVRPTLIAGPGGGAWVGLTRLARLPLTPVFGHGRTPLQPIYVDDLAEALVAVVREGLFAGETLELGGPESVAISDLLRRIRLGTGKSAGRQIRLPLGFFRWSLGLVEGVLRPVLPLTAGQLSTFAEDGTARPNHLQQRLAPHWRNVEAMIALAAADGKGA